MMSCLVCSPLRTFRTPPEVDSATPLYSPTSNCNRDWMRPSGPWMHYGINASLIATPGTGWSHIPQETSHDGNEDSYFEIICDLSVSLTIQVLDRQNSKEARRRRLIFWMN